MTKQELLEELELSLKTTKGAIEFAQEHANNTTDPETQTIHQQAVDRLLSEVDNIMQLMQRLHSVVE